MSKDFFSNVAGDAGNRRSDVFSSLKNAYKKTHLGKKFGTTKKNKPSHYFIGKYTQQKP
jgi:predicted phage tail protein